jgi:hypothetical protein
MVDPGEVGRSAVYSRYNNSPGTLPWGIIALTGDSSVYLVSTFTRKCLLCRTCHFHLQGQMISQERKNDDDLLTHNQNMKQAYGRKGNSFVLNDLFSN